MSEKLFEFCNFVVDGFGYEFIRRYVGFDFWEVFKFFYKFG